jgi:hypothetical protein
MTDKMAPEMERTLRALYPKAMRWRVQDAEKNVERNAAVLAELELMTSDADTEEAAQCDKRWHPWAMRQASVCHGGNATETVASALAWARGIVDGKRASRPLTTPSPTTSEGTQDAD